MVFGVGNRPTAIKKLLSMGYPAAKIKYFRGGIAKLESVRFKHGQFLRIVDILL